MTSTGNNAPHPSPARIQIFSHLHPLDILHLARTTKRLRVILMSPSAKSVRRAAFSNVQALPFCHSDMTEPQFANLAFDDYCHFCLAPNVHQVFWTCRVRCCPKCIPTYFIPEYVLEEMILDSSDIKLFRSSLLSTFPCIVHPKPRRNRPGRILYYLPMAERYISELVAIKRSEIERWRHQKKLEQTRVSRMRPYVNRGVYIGFTIGHRNSTS